MKVTPQLMSQWFAKFNDQYFDHLPEIPLKVGYSRTRLGSYNYKITRSLIRKTESDRKIILSSKFNLTETEWQNVMLHEMIHYYIHYHQLKDTSPHGPMFRAIMQRLNAQGWNIRISNPKLSLPQDDLNKRPTTRIIMVILLHDGRNAVGAVARTCVHKVHTALISNPDIKHVNWYCTQSKSFERFPNARTPKAVFVTKERLQTLLKELTPLEIHNDYHHND